MSLVRWVDVPGRSIAQLETVVGTERRARLVDVASRFRAELQDRTIWNISSTAVGGGVAEMLNVLLGYAEDLDVPIRWGVIAGDSEFFVTTKRLHNQIHGEPGRRPDRRGRGRPLRPDAGCQRRGAA